MPGRGEIMDALEMINKPENVPDNRKGQADYDNHDLSAHTYTGKGREAKHSSQMVHEKTEYSSQEAEGNFQRALVDKLSEEYQAKVNELQTRKSENETQIQAYKNMLGREDDRSDAILQSFMEVCENERKCRQEQRDALEEAQTLENDLARRQLNDDNDRKLLAEEEEKLEKLFHKIESRVNDFEEYNGKQNALETDEGLFAGARSWFYQRRARSKMESQQELTEEYGRQHDVVNQYRNRIKAVQQQQTEMQQRIALLREQAQIAKISADQYGELADQISAEHAMRFTQDYTENGAHSREYLEAYGLSQENKKTAQEIEANLEKKAGVDKTVQNADILNMATKGYQGTVRAISVDGKMYYDNTQLAEDGDENAPKVIDSEQARDFVEEEEEKIQLEEEKIVNQLKRRDVFQYMNSDNLMEYMDYDEKAADFIFQFDQQRRAERERGAAGGISQEGEINKEHMKKQGLTDDVACEGNLDDLASQGFLGGSLGILKFLFGMGRDLGFSFAGVSGIMQALEGAKEGNKDEIADGAVNAAGNMTWTASLALGTFLFDAMKNAGLGYQEQALKTFKLMGFDILGGTNISVMSGAAAAFTMLRGAYGLGSNLGDAQRLENYGDFVKQKGLNRFGRVIKNAETESRVQALGSAVDIGSGAVTAALLLTGVGGLAFTAANVAISQLIKGIGGGLIRRGTKKSILESPSVLGGLNYDKNIISEEHFNQLFAYVTGMNEPDTLADTLKVVDGIDLHRGMRRSMLKPDLEIDRAMSQLGFDDPNKYGNITLKKLHTRMGMTDDWRKTLRNAIEIEGLDYNTNWTKFVKGITGNANHYRKNARLTRAEMAERRRAEMAARA